MNLRKKIIDVLQTTISEDLDVFTEDMTTDEKIRLLPYESMLALRFITSIEDEFSIELNDDEIDMDFFDSLSEIEKRVQKYL
jgi:acyl carrier protein